ncbi:hypothetical protein LIER_13240 [Lithospermum erythrorhizon]|uniref:Uncharacterized protein n=1 Tax=Lithospermum erythrorhizon TaxID=34254 RepID=A0AAV3PWQ4_LITER
MVKTYDDTSGTHKPKLVGLNEKGEPIPLQSIPPDETIPEETLSQAAALDKKRAALGTGGVNEEIDAEPEKEVNVEELERLAEKRKAANKEKAKIKRPRTDQADGSIPKKRKAIVISEPKSPVKGDRFIVDDVAESDEEGAAKALRERSKVLHKAALGNLVPTSNNTNVSEALGMIMYVRGIDQQLNIGKVIFDLIVDHSRTGSKLKPIGFPSLIYNMLIIQHPHVLKKEDGLEEDAKSLTISDKLMKGKHVIDVEFNVVDQTEHALKPKVPPSVNDPPSTSAASPAKPTATTITVIETFVSHV